MRTQTAMLIDSTITEAEFQAQVTDLARMTGWRVYSIPDSRNATLAGWPDLTLIRAPQLIVAELKTEKGRLSPAQKSVLADLQECCIPTHVWRPSDWTDIVATLTQRPT